MASTDDISKFSIEMRRRVSEFVDRVDTDNPKFQRMLTEIGKYSVAEARRQMLRTKPAPIHDSGRLAKSLAFIVKGNTLKVGTDLIYARFHEQGKNPVSERQRQAIMATLREEGKLGRPSKGILSGNKFASRPYLRPTAEKVRDKLKDKLVEVLFLGVKI